MDTHRLQMIQKVGVPDCSRFSRKVGVLDCHKTRNWAVPPEFEAAGDFSEGLALVGIRSASGKKAYGYIDADGRFVFGPRADIISANRFSDGLAPLAVSRS